MNFHVAKLRTFNPILVTQFLIIVISFTHFKLKSKNSQLKLNKKCYFFYKLRKKKSVSLEMIRKHSFLNTKENYYVINFQLKRKQLFCHFKFNATVFLSSFTCFICSYWIFFTVTYNRNTFSRNFFMHQIFSH